MIKEERVVKFAELSSTGDYIIWVGVAFLSTYNVWKEEKDRVIEIPAELPLTDETEAMMSMLYPYINTEALRRVSDAEMDWDTGLKLLSKEYNDGFYYRDLCENEGLGDWR